MKLLIKANTNIRLNSGISYQYEIQFIFNPQNGTIRVKKGSNSIQSFALLHLITEVIDYTNPSLFEGKYKLVHYVENPCGLRIKSKHSSKQKEKRYRLDCNVNANWLENPAVIYMASYIKNLKEAEPCVWNLAFLDKKDEYTFLNPELCPKWIYRIQKIK